MFNFSFFSIIGWGIVLDSCDIEWFALETILSFLRLYPSTAFQTLFVDYEGYSISSKGFLPTVIDIVIIWIKFIHSDAISSLIPIMLMFTLAISCLTTSNLPWFMDLTFQVPMQDCSFFQHTFTQTSPLLGLVSALAQPLHFFLELLLCSIPVAYWAPTDLGVHISVSYLFCLFILFMGFSKQEWWSGLPFPSRVDHILWELPTMSVHLACPYTAGLIVSLS